jgi:ABC-2 type transport system permease protein
MCPTLYGVDMVNERFSKGALLKGSAFAELLPELYMLNPLAILMTGYRHAVFYGTFLEPKYWAIFTVEALLVFAIGYRLYQRYDRRVIKFL